MRPPIILDDAESVAREVARRFRESCLAAVASRGRFLVALAGGTTPRRSYELLRDDSAIPWSSVVVFFGDERCVDPTDGHSNYRMAREALLDWVPLPTSNVNRVVTELGCDGAARHYEERLRHLIGLTPKLDLVHLGVGPDGHVASLFPHTDLDSHQLVLVTTPTKGLDPQVGRVSLSLGLITSAREVVLVATGSGKASVVSDALSATSDLPAARVLRCEATLILDRDAGKFLDNPAAR